MICQKSEPCNDKDPNVYGVAAQHCRTLAEVYVWAETDSHKGKEMTKLLTALGTASLLTLTACGGGGSGGEANNTAVATDDVALPADENAALGDTLGDQANALDANTTDLNATTDANLTANTTDAGNATGDAAGNTTNAQ